MSARTWQELEAEAQAQLKEGELGRAVHTLVAAIEVGPGVPRLYEQLVRWALLAGGTGTAVQAATELRALDPAKGEWAYLLAVAQLASGQAERARDTLEETLTLLPDSWETRQALAQVSRVLGDGDRAQGLLEEAVRLAPTAPGPVNDLAVLLLGAEEAARAEAVLRPAVEAHPDDASLHLNLALALVKLEKKEEARDHATAARDTRDAEVREQADRLLASLTRH